MRGRRKTNFIAGHLTGFSPKMAAIPDFFALLGVNVVPGAGLFSSDVELRCVGVHSSMFASVLEKYGTALSRNGKIDLPLDSVLNVGCNVQKSGHH